MAKNIVFFDLEIGEKGKINDIGAVNNNKGILHNTSVGSFCLFAADAEFLCGHNAIHHDMKYLAPLLNGRITSKIIDTLYLSPLLFPKKPYHRLVKDDKLQVDEFNNPVNDSKKAKDLFLEEVEAFLSLPEALKKIFYSLLSEIDEFKAFFDYIDYQHNDDNLVETIKKEFAGKICSNADIEIVSREYPVELAYSLALIACDDSSSVIPKWLILTFPKIEWVVNLLCNTRCEKGCSYCSYALNVNIALKHYFGFSSFRTYNGENLQEKAAQAAVNGKSLLAVFPTGGGKSITFQLPALMAGKSTHGLTVVISPLQSLMKDQVDNLVDKGIESAVTINGMLNPIERADALDRVKSGSASILYISPEQLRSKTIEYLLLGRTIARFVIDEAHCFSAWGQDFRVDYLYIGDFIRHIQEQKGFSNTQIPVSCFTATAKQKVITDICDYFKRRLNLDLEIFATNATRENLHYTVLFKASDDEKYITLRDLIVQKNCPTIVYVSRTKRTEDIANKLTSDGLKALPYNGKMDANQKIINQEAFKNNEVSIMVATSAFGMGVDKSDVGLVVHYDISDSLENYVQEAGRAGRDASLQADCYVLFNDNDLDKHFILLNQTKLSISEIQQVWSAIKSLTKNRANVSCSALEIARQAGWNDQAGSEIETRVRTAISALESAGYIERGRNVPRVYATSIKAKNMIEASYRIKSSNLFSEEQKLIAVRIIKSLISSRSIANADNADAESRVDYLADILGLEKASVLESINLMRQEGLLADASDMSAYIYSSDNQHKSMLVLDRYSKLERFILSKLNDGVFEFGLKELNEEAQKAGILSANIKTIRTILFYLAIKNYIVKEEKKDACSIELTSNFSQDKIIEKFEKRIEICRFILEELYSRGKSAPSQKEGEQLVEFSLVGLYDAYKETPRISFNSAEVSLSEIEEALLYLSKIGALKLEGGFLVLYNGMEIKRIIKDNRIKYKLEDYRLLNEFYKQKIQQVHIVGEYANLMVRDYAAALEFVQNYFNMDFKEFIAKYFKGVRAKEIERNITSGKYSQLFGDLSEKQAEIISDSYSQHIVVAAGPGSGKTRLLVHKLASLLIMEDVKHEQLLMVTFSRAAATEFKKRLLALIGGAAKFVEVKTFHSYCFDLLGKIGSLEESDNVVKLAAEMIQNGEVEAGKITKSVLVIDEAQDMDEHEFNLVCALMERNDDMRVIAVGDDDQNIFEFRGSDSRYLKKLIQLFGARKYEMVENYRSANSIVTLANGFVSTLSNRMKQAPIKSVGTEAGQVHIVWHPSPNMEEALVRSVVSSKNSGTTCLLTNTNEEALQLLGLMLRHGKQAKLIQSLDGFKLYNLLEIRAFIKFLRPNKKDSSPIISEVNWGKAKIKLTEKYSGSTCFENVMQLLTDFEKTHPVKYFSDFEEFVKQSEFYDFYNIQDRGVIYISTIHKSKGREFDNVYILHKDPYGKTDSEKRALYVAITRAKHALYIHTNSKLFDKYSGDGIEMSFDTTEYAEPEELMLQTTYRDVVLSSFKGKRDIIFRLRSGMNLFVDGEYISVEIDGEITRIGKYSRAFVSKLESLRKKGYELVSSTVRFIVAWKGEEDTEETPIVLTDVHFKK